MWPFRRRKVGKHALGAAVTAIPSAPRPVLPTPALAEAFRSAHEVPTQTGEPVFDPVYRSVSQALYAEIAPAPRVELGFRDGSTAALAPGSDQAKALADIAQALTERN
jgi:hypothetical protein